MSKLQLNVDLSINDKLSAALERAIKPAQQLSEKFSALKEQAEKFKLSDIDTKSLEKLKSDADGVVNKVESLGDELKKLGEIKAKLEYFEALKKQTAEASTSLNNHKKSIKALQSQMQAGGGDSTLKKQLADLEKEAKKLQNTVDKNRPKLKKMRQDFNDAGLGGMKLSEAQVKISQSIKRTELAIDQQEGALKQLNTAHENHSRAIQRSLEKQKKLAKQAEETSRKIERQQQIIQKAQEARGYGIEALRIAGAVAGGAGYAVKEYAQSQDAETTLKISMMSSNGEVAKEYAKIVALAEKMGTKLPGTTADFKKMMSVLVQQGISFQSILGGVGESAGNLAVLLKMPFDEAAEFAAKLQDATKTTERDMMHLMDTVQKMYYLGADTVNIMGGFGNLSSSMAVLGKSGKEFVDEVAPLLVMADQAGMNGDSAGNAYRKIFASMMDTNGINKALADAGVNANFDFTNGKGEWGGLEKMFSQLEQLKGIDTQKRLEVLSAAFGGDAEVARALNVMIEKGQAGYDETIAKMARQADINQRVQEQLGTLTNLWDALSGTFTSLLARAGEALAPWIESITVWLTELGEKMSAFIERNPAIFNAFIKFAAVLGVAIAAIAAFVVIVSSIIIPLAALKMSLMSLGGTFGFLKTGLSVFGKIPGVFGILKTAFVGVSKAVLMLGRVMMANPILAVITAIAVAAYLIYANWDKIKPYLMAFWDGIKEKWNQFTAWVTDVWDGIQSRAFSAWEGIKSSIGGIWDSIKVKAQSTIDGVVDVFRSVIAKTDNIFANNPILNFLLPIIGMPRMIIANWVSISAFFSGLWTTVKTAVDAAWANITTAISNHWMIIKGKIAMYIQGILMEVAAKFSIISGAVSESWARITTSIGAAWTMIKALVSTGVSAIWSVIVSCFNAVSAFISLIWAGIKVIVSNAWNGLVSIFQGSQILSAIMSAFSAVMAWLSGLGARMRSIGTNIIDGLIAGIKSGFKRLQGVWQKVNSYMPSFSRKTMDIHSPSRVMRRIGGFIMDGVTLGIQRRFIPLKKTFGGVMNYLRQPIGMGRVAKVGAMADKIGSHVCSNNVLGDLARIFAPKLSNNPLVGFALSRLPKVLGKNTPKPANVTPIQSRPMPLDADGYKGVGGGHASTSNYTIHIHANPGMDERTLAKLVQAELERYEQRKAAKHRARMTD